MTNTDTALVLVAIRADDLSQARRARDEAIRRALDAGATQAAVADAASMTDAGIRKILSAGTR